MRFSTLWRYKQLPDAHDSAWRDQSTGMHAFRARHRGTPDGGHWQVALRARRERPRAGHAHDAALAAAAQAVPGGARPGRAQQVQRERERVRGVVLQPERRVHRQHLRPTTNDILIRRS